MLRIEQCCAAAGPDTCQYRWDWMGEVYRARHLKRRTIIGVRARVAWGRRASISLRLQHRCGCVVLFMCPHVHVSSSCPHLLPAPSRVCVVVVVICLLPALRACEFRFGQFAEREAPVRRVYAGCEVSRKPACRLWDLVRRSLPAGCGTYRITLFLHPLSRHVVRSRGVAVSVC